ncbi:MAG: response regulator [Gemmatimonadales bacterium]
MMMARLLRDEGYRVIEASTGKNALKALKKFSERLDLLVTDVAMPDIDGIELALRLRSQYPQLPVVFMSGNFGAELIHRDILGVDSAFLQKPFAPETVAECVRSLLDRTRR